MSLFKIFKGTSSDLGINNSTTVAHDGYAYFTSDDGKFYIDVVSTNSGTAPAIIRSASKPAGNRIPLSADKADRADDFTISGHLDAQNTGFIDDLSANSLLVTGPSSFTGGVQFSTIPTAPTAAAGDSTSSIATTEFVTNAINNSSYTLPAATNNALGGIKIGYSTSGKNYAVELNNEKAYVNVPWTDTKVNQSALDSSNSVEYKLLTSVTSSPSGVDTAGYSSNLAYNPSLNRLKTGNLELTGTLDVTQQVTFDDNLIAQGISATDLTVNGPARFNNGINTNNITIGNLNVVPTEATTAYTLTLPAKTDTIATLSDLPQYSLPTASSATLGGIKTGYTANGKNYSVVVDQTGNAYVNVPWQNDNTTSFTIAANATDGYWNLTGTSGTNAVTYSLAPYSSKQATASFYTGTTDPTLTTRLNYDGYFYATKLYSGGQEVLTEHQSLNNYLLKANGVTSVDWNTTGKKITKTINGNTSDVVQFEAGSNITLTAAAGKLTIASSFTNSRDPGYGKIKPGAASSATAGITKNTTQIVSTTYTELLTINPGNKWIELAATNGTNGDDDSFTIAHAISGVTAGNYGDSIAQTPGYGSTFKVPYVSVDEAGHITGISVHNVTIPASDNTDTKVNVSKDTVSTAIYLLGDVNTPSTTTSAHSAVVNNDLYFNATNETLNTKNVSLTGELNVNGDAWLYNETHIDSAEIDNLIIKGPATAQTPEAGSSDNQIATTEFVSQAITALPGPMRFIGTLGTGGTITTLPSASEENKGYTYKVIVNGTYNSQAAKNGDLFISTGTEWVYIPSADEPSGTITNIATGEGLSGGPITTTGTISHAIPTNASSGSKGSSTDRTYIKTITTDKFGHVTTVTTGVETVVNTDTLVKQNKISTNADYKLIFSNTSSPTSGNAAEVGYDTDLTYNPSTNQLSAGKVSATTFVGYLSGTFTARKLKVNLSSVTSTGVDFNGSQNVDIPVSGTLTTQQLARPTGLRGLNDVTLQALVNTTRANHLAFLPADQIIIEKTTDGGVTWVDAGVSDEIKLQLFSETRPTGVKIPLLNGARSLLCGLRITITAMKYNVPDGTPETEKYNYWNASYVKNRERYCQLKDMYFWLTAVNDSIGVTVQKATGANSNNWIDIFNDSTYYMTGWSGCDYINFSQSAFGGNTNQTGYYWNYRIILMTKGTNGTTTMATSSTGTAQSILEIRAYGDTVWGVANNYMAYDHIYSFDANQNVTFPAMVTATTFVGQLQGNADTATKATNDSENNVINTTYIKKSVLSGAYDIMYSSATNTPARLAANTSTTKKFLQMTGTGSAGAAPAWDTVAKEDVGLGNVLNEVQVTSVTLTDNLSLNYQKDPNGNFFPIFQFLSGTNISITCQRDKLKFSHIQSGVTADSYGATANASSYGDIFKVPKITVDSQGHITSATDYTITLPAAPTIAGLIGAATGSATQGIYWNGTNFTPMTHEVKATVNTGTTNQIAYYSNTSSISGATLAWDDWVNGSTSGPRAVIKIGNTSYTANPVPIATATQSGVISTTTQQFAGDKTFQGNIYPSSSSYNLGSSVTAWGNIYATTMFSSQLNTSGDLNITGNAYLNNETYADSLTTNSLVVRGSAIAQTPEAGSNDEQIATTEFVSNAIAAIPEATDRYVNSATFTYHTTNDNVLMTLTRAGSDTNTITANIPKVSTNNAGVVPKGVAVTAQSQTSQFLRSDGTWATPSYTKYNNFGICSTSAGTTAKVVNIPYFTHTNGDRFYVQFNNQNTVQSPTLNVNSFGAEPIYDSYGQRLSGGGSGANYTSLLNTNKIYEFMYDSDLNGGSGGYRILNNIQALELQAPRESTTSLNLPVDYGGLGSMFHILATNKTATASNAKTPFDANILQMNWDNSQTGNYNSQLGIATGGTRMVFRSGTIDSHPWQEVAHAPAGSAVGSSTQPIYMNSNGQLIAAENFKPVYYNATSTSTSFIYVKIHKTSLFTIDDPTMLIGEIYTNSYNNSNPGHITFQITKSGNNNTTQPTFSSNSDCNISYYDPTNTIKSLSLIYQDFSQNSDEIYLKIQRLLRLQKFYIYVKSQDSLENLAEEISVTSPGSSYQEDQFIKVYNELNGSGSKITLTGTSQAVITSTTGSLITKDLSGNYTSTTNISFINSILQASDGKITATTATIPDASTSTKGIVKLSSATDDEATNVAATPYAVKAAYQAAIAAQNVANTTRYWANIPVASTTSYTAQPEVQSIKINGSTTASAATTKNVTLVYDASLEVLNFVFS